MERERFTSRDKKPRNPVHDRFTMQRATDSELLAGRSEEQDFDLRKPQPDQATLHNHPASVRETLAGHNHSVDVRQEQNSDTVSIQNHDDLRFDTAPVMHDTVPRSFRQAPSHEGASERQPLSETNRQQQGAAYHSRFTVPVEDETLAPDALPGTVRISDETKTAEHITQPAENIPLSEPAAGSPLSDRPGRLRFDDTPKPDPSGAASAQHSSAYSRRFTVDTKQPENTGTDSSAATSSHSDKSSDSSVPPKKSKLNFTADETPPTDLPPSKKLAKAHAKADKSAAKLEKAQEKLPTHRRVRIKKESDSNTGKPVRKFTFEKEVKSQRAHVKGPLPLRPVKAGANAGIAYGHTKIHEVEHENVGTEAVHKGELTAEGALRYGYRSHKTRPYRRVAKLQHKSTKHAINASYQQALHDNPKLKSNIISRTMQKQKIKRQYAQAAHEAKRTGKAAGTAAKKTGDALATTGRAVATFAKSHPAVCGILALILLLMFLILGFFSSCSNMAAGGLSSVLASSYLAEEADIDNAELVYTEWETDLQIQISQAESDYPRYDEYRYSVDDIGHNSYELMAFLTAAHQNFTYAQISGLLSEMFAEQYSLSFTPETEIRTRTETRSDTYTDPETYTDTYEVEVEYEWYVLNITMTARSFTDVAVPRLNSDQREIYELLIRSKGNRQYLSNVFGFNCLPYVSSNYGWRVHPISGEKNYHKGTDIAVAQGTPILAGHDGVVTDVGFDADGYGNYVVISGDDGIVSKYAHCETVSVSIGQEITAGDTIATVGSTGNSTGPHLHLEIIKNGQYLNPIYFAETGDDGFSSLPPGSPGGPAIPDYPGEPMGDGSFAALMEEAQKHLGKPYIFGASGPNSFDCSGFVCYALNNSGVASVGRTTAQGLYNISTPVSRENAMPGDLIFFHSTYSTTSTVTHIGIYIGNGQMIHAGNPVQYASIDTNYWTDHFYAFGRVGN